MKKNLVLTGMMGVGKSTIGKSLSKTLNIHFKDVDKIIEKKQSLSITEIFDLKGEEFFRNLEETESMSLIKKSGLIIALGGGAFMNEKIRKNVKQFCISIWLDLSSEEIFTRTIKFNKRPLLKNIKSKDDIEKLYSKRRNTYSLADHKIDCNGKSEIEVVNKIKEIYENI